MRPFPVYHAIAIVALLASIFLVLLFLPKALREAVSETNDQQQSPVQEQTMEAIATFRFNAKPKSISLMDEENNEIFKSEDIEYDYDLEVSPLYIPVNQNDQSRLRLVVEWSKMPENFYFFTLELNAKSEQCFGTHTPDTSISENVFFQW